MDFEESMSSWIGKLRDGFDTFCLEAKDILPQVENVQEQLITAVESVKQFVSDLDVLLAFNVDSEEGKGPKSDETEENVDLCSESRSSDQKKDVAESAEMEEIIDMIVIDDQKDATSESVSQVRLCHIPIEVEHGTFRYYPISSRKSDKFEVFQTRFFKDVRNDTTDRPELVAFRFSEDEIHKSSPSTTKESSDCCKPEIQSSHYSTFDYESEAGPLDTMTFLDSDSVSVPVMSECWSNFAQSPAADTVVAAESKQEHDEINEWERLEADFSDEDWEIV